MNENTGYTKNLTSLQVWQKAMDFTVSVCKEIIPNLPKEEQYALADQLRRAVQSIPANIAEGFGRYHYQDAIRFCHIARGSISEVYSHLTFARKMDYLNEDRHRELIQQIEEVHRMLNGYINFLRRSKQGQDDRSYHIGEPSSDSYETSAELAPEDIS